MWDISDDKRTAVALEDSAYVQSCQLYKWNSNKRVCVKFQTNPGGMASLGVVSANSIYIKTGGYPPGSGGGNFKHNWSNLILMYLIFLGQDCWFETGTTYCDGAKLFDNFNKPKFQPGDVVCARFSKGYLTFVKNNVRILPQFPLKPQTKYRIVGYGNLGQRTQFLN